MLPPLCEACGNGAEDAPGDNRLCRPCRALLLTTFALPHCRRCGGTLGRHLPEDDCSLCREERFAFDRVARLGRYEGALADGCRRLKHRSGERLAYALGDLLGQFGGPAILGDPAGRPAMVVPIPLHWRRRLSRGYDQAATVSLALAHRLRLPHRPTLLRRIKGTGRQVGRTPTERKAGVKNAFACRHPWRGPVVRGATVVLVDDVLTTGTTAHDAARTLKKAGAVRVVMAVLARGDHVGLGQTPDGLLGA